MILSLLIICFAYFCGKESTEEPSAPSEIADALDHSYKEQRHEDIVQASEEMNRAADQGTSWQLRCTADLTALIPGLNSLAMNDLDKKEAAKLRQELHQETKQRYLLQGFSTKVPWQPAAKTIFDAWTTIRAPQFAPERIKPFRE